MHVDKYFTEIDLDSMSTSALNTGFLIRSDVLKYSPAIFLLVSLRVAVILNFNDVRCLNNI
jgi:uncharacterized protein with NAD-binding domain and iron-sulfur cluster